MEDQTSWKSHSFTLLVFTGIVVLCSIFFILGMLVGRDQGQKFAFAASATAATKAEARQAAMPKEDGKPDLTFYDSVKQAETKSLEPPSAPVAVPAPVSKNDSPAGESAKLTRIEPLQPEAAPASAPAPAPAPARSPEKILNYQIGAVRKSSDAEKLLDQLKKKGFRGFILAPASDDPNPYFRIQVGPFADMIEADGTKKKLESAGYQPILKK